MQYQPLEIQEQRLAEEAVSLREQARLLPPGAVREATIRRARQAETGSPQRLAAISGPAAASLK
jgi:hypothetical protein